MEAEVNI